MLNNFLVVKLETVFDTVNQETDKIEQKRRTKFKQNNIYDDEKTSDLILQGLLKKNAGTFGFSWQIRYSKLYPNRLELHHEKGDKDPEVMISRRPFLESVRSAESIVETAEKQRVDLKRLFLFDLGLHHGQNRAHRFERMQRSKNYNNTFERRQ